MRIFKNTWFIRFANKEGITDAELRETVRLLETGQADADLGGGVYKARIARPGEGKSGGYRVIVFFKRGVRTFFVYSFAKSDRANIDRGELQIFKDDAKDQLAMTDEQIKAWLKNGTLIEILQEAGMKYKSEIYEAVHQDAVEMFRIGAISEDRMREYDKKCLIQEPEASPAALKTVTAGNADVRLTPNLPGADA